MTTDDTPPVKTTAFERTVGFAVSFGCLVISAVTLLTLFARYHWVLDLLANLRIQLVIALCPLLVAAVYLNRSGYIATLLLCLVFHGSTIGFAQWTSRSIPIGASADDAKKMRLMAVNVLTKNRNHDAIANHIRDSQCDFVAVLELSDDLDEFLQRALADTHPHHFCSPDSMGNFGIGVYSKTRFDDPKLIYFSDGLPSIQCTLDGLNIIATHPLPPMGSRLFRSRNQHLGKLAEHLQTASQQIELKPVVMGDLNVTPWSPVFSDFTRSAGLRRTTGSLNWTPTWYARTELFPMGLVLDHILVGPEIESTDYRVGPNIGSDHRSVTVTLSYPVDRTIASTSDL